MGTMVILEMGVILRTMEIKTCQTTERKKEAPGWLKMLKMGKTIKIVIKRETALQIRAHSVIQQ